MARRQRPKRRHSYRRTRRVGQRLNPNNLQLQSLLMDAAVAGAPTSKSDYFFIGNPTQTGIDAITSDAQIGLGPGFVKHGWNKRTPATLNAFGLSSAIATPAQLALREKLKMRGRGLYMGGRGGYWGRKIGGLFGQADLGDRLGDMASNYIRGTGPVGNLLMDGANLAATGMRLAGHGDYTTNDTMGTGDGIPTFSTGAPDTAGDVVVTHKEYIGTLYGGSDPSFSSQVYALNPGIANSFPWLSQIAQNYEEYSLIQCLFTFKSRVSDFAANNGQVGEVLMAVQYNPSDAPFADKSDLLQYALRSVGKCTADQLHGVECDPAKLSGTVGKYVRAGPPSPGQDLKTLDHGTLNVVVCGIPDAFINQPLGELFVSYTVQLRKPKQFTNKGWGAARDVWYGTSNGVVSATPEVPTPSLGDVRWLKGQQNSIGTLVESSSAPGAPIKVTFPVGYTGNVSLRVVALADGANTIATYAASTPNSIVPISDIPPMTAGGSWASGLSTGVASECVYDAHLCIKPVVGGVDNVYSVLITPGLGATGPGHFYVEVIEWNTRFNYGQAPGRDQIMLIDPLTGQLVPI